MPAQYRFNKKPDQPVARILVCGDDGMDYFFDADGKCIGSQPTDAKLLAIRDNAHGVLADIRSNYDATQIAPKP